MTATAHQPRPDGSHWTDEQWAAIATRGHSMLVAAAAGSGKTAVLVERIIRRIADPIDPIDVDRLLVATFTKAAAAEMRHRIGEALEKALTADPESEHLRRQLALLPRASITTLHSFCMEVIQTHYASIGLDPGFRIANETESALLRQDLLEELLEERYGQAVEDDPFWRLADAFSGDKNDDKLLQLVQRIYDDSRSHPDPEHWLETSVRVFEETDFTGSNPWITGLQASVRIELQGMRSRLEEALYIAGQSGGPEPYTANLEEDLDVIGYLIEIADTHAWEHLYHAVQGAGFGKLRACRGEQYDKLLQEQVKDLRNAVKEQLSELREELFGRPPEQHEAELLRMAPLMRTLTEVVNDFGKSYRDAKKAKNLVDFADLEHYCLDILRDSASLPETPVPSAAALEYRKHFAEVLLDEYQDTNRVQETIVELLASASPGNRFMVGDVKQSIYRFRLADPGLFQQKYKSYRIDAADPGQRIDLARNFRSRREVVDGTNYLFRQLMNETVGEIEYDRSAELIYGAGYPDPDLPGAMAAELVLIDRTAESSSGRTEEEAVTGPEDEYGAENGDSLAAEARELEAAQLEARFIAQRIRSMLGMDGGSVQQVYDKAVPGMRSMTFRDIVVLLRATKQWAPVLIEELRQQGIPAYAELNTGYFTAVEVQVLLSLLKVIDNPYQDIPLASVLRSPLVSLGDDELARIRIASRSGAFFEAVRLYADEAGEVDQAADVYGAAAAQPKGGAAHGTADGEQAEARRGDDGLDAARVKLRRFLKRLADWRNQARQGSLADLIWDIFRQTAYFDFVGGLPGGQQRQANLRALYDRARQYEETSFRGLFRFLRFIERMQDSGGDLGTARALGEQEDVVRIMTIHKSKGLEFPVVFVAGTNKLFNRRDLTDAFLLHKELGFGPKLTEPESRVSYPTLPWLAIKRKIQMEMLAEEMRVLYVALTRAKEKLILIATVRNLQKQLAAWGRYLTDNRPTLPDDLLARAKTYLDWIGPALIRHPAAGPLREAAGLEETYPALYRDEVSLWRMRIVRQEQFAGVVQAAVAVPFEDSRMEQVLDRRPVGSTERYEEKVTQVLSWSYPHEAATDVPSNTSVTELKQNIEQQRLHAAMSEEPPSWMWPAAEANRQAAEESRPDGGTSNASVDFGKPGNTVSRPRAEQIAMDFFSAATPLSDMSVRTSAQADALGQQEAGGRARTAQGPGALPSIVRKPRFMEQRETNAVDRGTSIHAMLQRLPLDREPSEADIRELAADLVRRELLAPEHAKLADPAVIAAFFRSEAGRRILRADNVYREVPFHLGLPASEVPGGSSDLKETVKLQGVIDCLIDEGDGLVLIDYKTDRLKGASPQQAAERYRIQLDLYERAVETIWKRPVKEKYIFLFDGAHMVPM